MQIFENPHDPSPFKKFILGKLTYIFPLYCLKILKLTEQSQLFQILIIKVFNVGDFIHIEN